MIESDVRCTPLVASIDQSFRPENLHARFKPHAAAGSGPVHLSRTLGPLETNNYSFFLALDRAVPRRNISSGDGTPNAVLHGGYILCCYVAIYSICMQQEDGGAQGKKLEAALIEITMPKLEAHASQTRQRIAMIFHWYSVSAGTCVDRVKNTRLPSCSHKTPSKRKVCK